MPTIHVLSFAYKSSTPASTRADVFARLMALRTQCLVPASGTASAWSSPALPPGTPYISDLKGGRENISPEGHGKGFDHTFVFEFPSSEAIRYYLEEDPAHLGFVNWVGQYLQDVYVYDFAC